MRFTKLVLKLRVTTYDLRQVTSPITEVKIDSISTADNDYGNQYSETELDTGRMNILVSIVTDRWSVIKGKFTPGLTIQKKNSCWQEIADRYPLYVYSHRLTEYNLSCNDSIYRPI